MRWKYFSKQNKINCLLILCLIFFLCAGAAEAAVLPDLNRTGEIRLTMKDQNGTVAGGTMTLFRIGNVEIDDGNYSYALTEEFRDSGISLEQIGAEELPEQFEQYIKESQIEGIEKEIDETGLIAFEELSPGLYFIMQEQAAEGYYKVRPFVATVPCKNGETWEYIVDAEPKLEEGPEKRPDMEMPDQDIPDEDEPGGENGGTGGGTRLPQTGQMNWPIPFLLIGGVCIFVAGWSLYRKKDGR